MGRSESQPTVQAGQEPGIYNRVSRSLDARKSPRQASQGGRSQEQSKQNDRTPAGHGNHSTARRGVRAEARRDRSQVIDHRSLATSQSPPISFHLSSNRPLAPNPV